MPAIAPGSIPFAQTLQRLRNLSQQDCQGLWRGHLGDLPLIRVLKEGGGWPITTLNSRQHVAWGRGQQVLWLYQQITIPQHLQGYALSGLTLRLSLMWWAEDAQIFVNGERVQCGDLFDYFTRICLADKGVIGTCYSLAVRLVSPGHDDGAMVRSQLLYEVPSDESHDWPSPEPGFVADELAALGHYVQTLVPDRMAEIEQATAAINWTCLSASAPTEATRQSFQQSLARVRQQLKDLGQWVRQRQISCVGHAHLDMAWLWPVADTWQAAERTFESVLGLQQDFPELTYTHSSPALFAWLERNRPDLFARVQAQVQAGCWSIDAGLWIEPELNILSGESIARQILYGQRYCWEKFACISTIAWLPDTFGFCHQLPQLLTLGGIEVFATQKLRWNDTTQFPHELFHWHGPDGSRVLGWTLPPIGTDFDPIQIAEYAAQWEAKTGISQALWLPGVGDHGGGPTREMLESARRWAQSPLFPTVTFMRPEDFMAEVRATQSTELPVWDDELYLELHRGCYTTHADQKWSNRRCEDLLYEAELWGTIAHLVAERPYPQKELEQAWKLVLFNQFHDILPGSAIPEVFEDANRDWQHAQGIAADQLEQALQQIQSHLVLTLLPRLGARPIVVFNSLSWDRTALVSLSLKDIRPSNWNICGSDGQPVPCQILDSQPQDLIFRATVPAVGYAVYWLCQREENLPISALGWSTLTEYGLENEYLRVRICTETGDILSLFDRMNGREVLSGPANQLQAFADDGQYWDAWNISPDYERRPLATAQVEQMQWLERGPLRQRLQVQRRLGQSTLTQVYCLEADSPLLKIETEVDWQETQVLLKVNFPTSLQADVATYEAPFGATVRSTHSPPPGTTLAHSDSQNEDVTGSESTTPDTTTYIDQHAKTKWEVPALRWADLTDPNQDYGLSILTDGKHGFDSRPHQLRLTLLKTPLWPDPDADRGMHRFTYALYPHQGSWQAAKSVQRARELNQPLVVRKLPIEESVASVEQDVARQSFLRVNNGVLSALKLAEAKDTDNTSSNTNNIILRCYDAVGSGLAPEIETALNLQVTDTLDLLERPLKATNAPQPYQIWTYKLTR